MNKIFISYSHQDEQWKDLLQSHLSVIEKQSKLRIWDDRQIATGDDWFHEIEKALTTSESAILLISRHFLTSDFILSKEIPRLLQRREKEGLRIIPLIISPCAWQAVDWLAAIQGYPADNIPLSSKDEHEIDRLLAVLGQQLYEQVEVDSTENTENKTTLQQAQSQATPNSSNPLVSDTQLKQKPATNPTVKAAWIGAIAMLIAALITAAVTLYKPEQNEEGKEDKKSITAKPERQIITIQASGNSTTTVATDNATINYLQIPTTESEDQSKDQFKEEPKAERHKTK